MLYINQKKKSQIQNIIMYRKGLFMTKVFLGKPVSDQITLKLSEELNRKKHKPKLKTIRVGSNEDDVMYESMIAKKMASLEIQMETLVLDENSTDHDIISIIHKLNSDKDVDGIMLFRPLPKHLNEADIVSKIDPGKDVDSANPVTKIYRNIYPCTAQAVIDMLEFYDISISGKNVTILGRSAVVGRPLVDLFLNRDATVTVCHSKSSSIKSITKNADIIVSAIGSAEVIGSSFVSENTVVIDVGININKDGKLCGDVKYDELISVCSAISPVPRGIGSVTTSILARNLVKLSKTY